jgi:hypothetical protein
MNAITHLSTRNEHFGGTVKAVMESVRHYGRRRDDTVERNRCILLVEEKT